MSEIVVTKRAKSSNSKDPLENFSKLSNYAKKSTALAKRQAKVNGIAFTIIKNKKVYKVFPDGKKIEIHRSEIKDQNSFEPLRVVR
jgi:hypothetical protein